MSALPRILVADDPAPFVAFRAALASTFTLVHASTLEKAKDALEPAPTLVVCGCHFDEGRMYDLLRCIKAAPDLRNVPFMAVRCIEGELDDALYESVKIAVRALGGNTFVDLPRWQRRWGAAEASHRLTRLVQMLATVPPVDTALQPSG
jgi:CheY-like chemotaxis protein